VINNYLSIYSPDITAKMWSIGDKEKICPRV